MSRVDIVFLFILAIGGFLGYRRGFLMELFFLVALVLGVFIGFKLMGAGVDYLHKHFNADRAFLPYISFLIIFVAVAVGVTLLGKSIKNSLDETFLGKMDAAAGAVTGVLKYAFCMSVMIWLAASLHYTLPARWTDHSRLYPVVKSFAPGMAGVFGSILPFFKEIFKQF